MKLIRHFLVCVAALTTTTLPTISAVDSSSLRSRSDEVASNIVRGPNESEKNSELVDTSEDSSDDVVSGLALEFKAAEVGLAVEVDTDQTLDNDRRLRGFSEEKANTLPKTPKATAKPTSSKPPTTTKTPATPKSTKPIRTHAPSTTPTPAPTTVAPEPTDMATLPPTV